jgi:hypothetical protein
LEFWDSDLVRISWWPPVYQAKHEINVQGKEIWQMTKGKYKLQHTTTLQAKSYKFKNGHKTDKQMYSKGKGGTAEDVVTMRTRWQERGE